MKSQKAALILLILISLVVRLIRLNDGLWLDEILTYVNYAKLPFSAIVTTFDSENQHFLYSLLAHASFLVFGESAWALRLPAVLFGVGSIWALYLVGREVATETEALLAATLLAFSYHHIWFSQNARGYTGMLFWTLLSSWLLIRGLDKNRARYWVFYGISATLGVYTHMTMIFVVVGQFAVTLFTVFYQKKTGWTRQAGYPFLGFCLAGVLTLALYAPVLPQVFGTIGGGGEKSVVTAWKNPVWTLLEIIRGLEVGFVSGFVAVGALIWFGVGLVSYLKTRPILVGLLGLPPSLGAAVVIAIGHHLWPRFFFFAMGFGVLVLVRGGMVFGELAAKLAGKFVSSPRLAGIVLCAAMILVSAASVPFAYGPKQDYGGALAFITANLQPGDSVVTVGLTELPYRDLYKTGWESVDSLEALNAVRARSGRTWLVYTFQPVLSSVSPEIMDNIQRDFVLVEQFNGTVGAGMIYVCRADGQLSTLR